MQLHQPIHICMLIAQQREMVLKGKLPSDLVHICVYICAMKKVVPSARMSLLVKYIFYPIYALPSLPPPLSFHKHSQLSFPRISEKKGMASPYSSPFSDSLEKLCVLLSVFYIFTPTEEAWDVGFFVYMSLTATGGI